MRAGGVENDKKRNKKKKVDVFAERRNHKFTRETQQATR